MTVPVVRLPAEYAVNVTEEKRVVIRRSASQGVNPDESLERALHKKEEVIDLVGKVNDDTDMSMMDLSMEIPGTDEVSRDSEGFAKCRTHRNKDGVMVPDTPTREKEVITVEDDLGPDPGISIEAPDEETKPIPEVSVAKVDPSVSVTLAAPVKRDQGIAGGGGQSAPVIPPAQGNQTELAVRGGSSVPLILTTATIRPGTVTVEGAVNVLRTLPVRDRYCVNQSPT